MNLLVRYLLRKVHPIHMLYVRDRVSTNLYIICIDYDNNI